MVEVAGAFRLPNDENDAFAFGFTAATGLLKLVVVAAVDDDGQPPRDEPKPNCGLQKNIQLEMVTHGFAIFKFLIESIRIF